MTNPLAPSETSLGTAKFGVSSVHASNSKRRLLSLDQPIVGGLIVGPQYEKIAVLDLNVGSISNGNA